MKFERPIRYSEANVQGEFYHRCKLLGLRFCLQYTYANCRFDAVMINDSDEIYAIVEFKSKRRPEKYSGERKGRLYKQLDKYSRFGIPVLVCVNFEGIQPTLERILSLRSSATSGKVEVFK